MRPTSLNLILAGTGMVLLFGCRPATPGNPGPPAGSNSEWFISASDYYAGAHGDLRCAACHLEMMSDDQVFPHGRADLRREYEMDDEVCAACHPQAYKEAKRGAHVKAAEDEAKARERGMDPISLTFSGHLAPRSQDCHSIHHRQTPREE